ncbi:MAG: sulfite exporter TauE/SafE family protein [Solirubrobacterales bacterium]|nr:sulfite exporter TauE/SafE family protein [Solirubrobacterales bacterium]
MDFSPFLIVLVAFGVMSGTLAGLLGVGGGIFMVPFLVLAVGLTQQEAQATSLLVVLPTAVVATWSLHRSGVVDLRKALKIGLSGIVGSVAGAALALHLPGQVLKICFAILLVIVGVKLLRDAQKMKPGQKGPPRPGDHVVPADSVEP